MQVHGFYRVFILSESTSLLGMLVLFYVTMSYPVANWFASLEAKVLFLCISYENNVWIYYAYDISSLRLKCGLSFVNTVIRILAQYFPVCLCKVNAMCSDLYDHETRHNALESYHIN